MLGTLVNRNPKFPKDYLYNDQIISFYQFQSKSTAKGPNTEQGNIIKLNKILKFYFLNDAILNLSLFKLI